MEGSIFWSSLDILPYSKTAQKTLKLLSPKQDEYAKMYGGLALFVLIV